MGYCIEGSGNSTRKYCPESDGDVEIVTSGQLWIEEMMIRMFADERVEPISRWHNIEEVAQQRLTPQERPEGPDDGPSRACRAEHPGT